MTDKPADSTNSNDPELNADQIDRLRKLYRDEASTTDGSPNLPGGGVVGNNNQAKQQPIAGRIIGNYKLLENIDEGGMGSVWVADQLQPVKRRVAIKLIKAGMDSKSVLARFEAERQALALMDHPNIAKVFDGGMTDSGHPYFVMEYVKGVPIT